MTFQAHFFSNSESFTKYSLMHFFDLHFRFARAEDMRIIAIEEVHVIKKIADSERCFDLSGLISAVGVTNI